MPKQRFVLYAACKTLDDTASIEIDQFSNVRRHDLRSSLSINNFMFLSSNISLTYTSNYKLRCFPYCSACSYTLYISTRKECKTSQKIYAIFLPRNEHGCTHQLDCELMDVHSIVQKCNERCSTFNTRLVPVKCFIVSCPCILTLRLIHK